jgi:hypothetical protein
MSKLNGKWVVDGSVDYVKLNIADGDLTIAKTSGLQTALNDKVDDSEKGAANGVATLDAGGKIPVAQLPSSLMEYKGTWNASTNSPALVDGTGDVGDVYKVSTAGTQDLGSGNIVFSAGDWVIYNGTIWEKSINSDAVDSVNSQTGAVVLDADDISDASTTNKFVSQTELNKLSNISVTQAVDLDTMESDISTNSSTISSHLNGEANKHDASEIDVEVAGNYLTVADLATNLTALDTQIKTNADNILTAASINVREEFVLDATDISNGYIDLANTPIAASIQVHPDNGPIQRNGVDFTISTARLTFDGDLASLLEDGDVLVVYYQY